MPGMRITPTEIEGLAVVEGPVYVDERGWFTESFNQRDFDAALAAAGLAPAPPMVQDNHSFSQASVLRGLHFQVPPQAQGKLVRVLQGAIHDVAVDIRAGSPTFGSWFAMELFAANHRQLWVPAGFAHGFQVIGETAEVLYKTTAYYAPAAERSIAWNDPTLAIDWPNPASAIVSAKDGDAPHFSAIRAELLTYSF